MKNLFITLVTLSSVLFFNRTDERLFNYHLKPIAAINLFEENIFRPTMLSVNDSTEDMALYSYAEHVIYTFDQSEKRINKFGIGRGGGPREFRNPMGLSLDPEGNIWIADPPQARISIWSPDSGLIRTFNHHTTIPENIAVSEDFYVLELQEYTPMGFLQLYNRKDKFITTFGIMEDEFTKSNLLLDCTIVVDRESIYVGGYNAGFIKKFKSTGELSFSVPTIEPVEPVELVRGEITELEGYSNVNISYHKISEESPRAIVDMDVDDGVIYVLFSGTKSALAQYIDIYDKFDGQYKGSIQISDFTDDTVLELETAKGKLFLMTNDENSIKRIRTYEISTT